ncbi:MAG: phospholipid carrier-dependent glycosyltransferase [Chloroflexi bacterium]|nr:phospholipid carrier-dependent glycosyltransferase [Chloroflexota bacterium]
MKNNMTQSKRNTFALVLLLLALILPSWLIQNDRVINVDEPRWMIRGANFYYALAHLEFENTIYEYHPGVTNMWIVGTAMHFYFPEYRGFGQGYFDALKPKFEEFMRNNGKEALDLARYSRFIHAGVLAVLVVTAFFLLRLLVDANTALFSAALVSLSPFFLGHSRLMNLEGMLSLFVLLSILGMQVYLNHERKPLYLILSGLAFALSQLTKSSSIVVVGVVVGMLFVELFKQSEKNVAARILDVLKIFMIWFASAALAYFILWPGMWVAPQRMLSEVYGNAFSYAFQGARLEVTQELEPDSFGFESGFEGILHFLGAWASSTTPITWFGLAFIIFPFFSRDNYALKAPLKSLVVYLTAIGGLFIVMFSLAKGRDSQHYILSSYVAFDVIAGLGWGYALMQAKKFWVPLHRTYVSFGILIVLIFVQIGIGLPYAPYYFNYKNPLAMEPATFGYGEGYSEAADYLAQKPNVHELQVYVYSGLGTFSYFFPGETLVLKRVFVLDGDFITIVRETRESDYLVLYPIVREKQPEVKKILSELEGVVEPEKVITINGLEYVQIYKVTDIPESVYEALLKKAKETQ